MGRLTDRLNAYQKVGIDTSIFIYHFEEHPDYFPLTYELLSEIEAGQREGITSSITLMELIVMPLKLNREDIARKYEALLVNFPHLQVVDLNRPVIRRAAQLRAAFRLRPADALQAAAVMAYGAEALVSNDRRLVCLKPLIDVIILEDIIRL